MGEKSVDTETKEKAVWTDIDNAFSQPIMLHDTAVDYVPTQILAELFSDVGYDAIIYRSQFSDDPYNIAVFNIDDATIVNCAPYEVEHMEVAYREVGNRWYSRDK